MAFDDTLSHDEAAAITEEAYIFFFPMLMGYRYAFGAFLVPSLPSHRVPLNVLGGEPVTLDHTFKDVITPNADTPYSMAGLDLRAEPMVLSVPEVKDRYYVMQFEDLFGMNEHFVGTRATGTDPGTYLIAGPNWNGETPDGIDAVLRNETDLVFLIGRTQIFGPHDVEATGRVMSLYHLRPLSAYLGSEPVPVAPYDWPVWNDEASRDERFITYANALLPLCQPTHPDEAEIMARFARIGLVSGEPFDVDALDQGARAALKDGVDAARSHMAEASESIGEIVNGWTNTDPFGDREFYAGDYMLRAVGAMVGWGGNDKIEAFYPMARTDAEGVLFDGENRYRLTFDTLPPARAFWSVTMYNTEYDGTAGFFVENPIGRYLINSTTEGLVYGDDGSLAIAIQRNAPTDPTEQANWLPAPEGTFYLALRLYYPAEEALTGAWTPPPVTHL